MLKRGKCLKWGSANSSLSRLFCDSYFEIMRFRSDKEPSVDIRFNALGQTKNLLLKNPDILENDEFVSETDSEDEENGYVQIGSFNEENDGKFLFIYQVNDMKRIYRKYAPCLILLDATYKATKYALPLYFLAVKTNVNYQVRPNFSLISIYGLF